MPKNLGQNIWAVDGPEVTAAMGFHYPTRMILLRINTQDLVVISPIALNPELRVAVDALGMVAHLIAPNSLHHLYMQDWATAYPNAKIYGAPGLAAKRTDLDFDFDLGAADFFPNTAWQGQLEQVIFSGNIITTEVVFFHPASGTAIFTDLLQQLPKGWFRGWRAWVAYMDLMQAPLPSVPRKFRLAFRSKADLRVAAEQVLDWQVERITMAHGPIIEKGAAHILRRAFDWI